MRPVCVNPFAHRRDLADTRDHDCGHQYDVLLCGCVLDDHDDKPCDGCPVAELQEAR